MESDYFHLLLYKVSHHFGYMYHIVSYFYHGSFLTVVRKKKNSKLKIKKNIYKENIAEQEKRGGDFMCVHNEQT